MKRKNQSRRLVDGYLERISQTVFSTFQRPLTNLIGRRHGVYALYKKDRLYYVGLATNLRSRVKQHLSDKHAGKWDRFSLYLVKKVDHIREIETLILRMADPSGNTSRGRLRHAHNLLGSLDESIHREQNAQRLQLLGSSKLSKIRMPAKRSIQEKRKPIPENPIARVIKLPASLRGIYRGKELRAKVRMNGTVRMNGKVYTSLSDAASAAAGRPRNGWWFWKANVKGEWIRLSELRRRKV